MHLIRPESHPRGPRSTLPAACRRPPGSTGGRRALAEIIVLTESVPLAWVTVKPALMVTSSAAPGKVLPSQLFLSLHDVPSPEPDQATAESRVLASNRSKRDLETDVGDR